MDELKKLRRRVAQEQAEGRGAGGKRYTIELRRDVSAYLSAARAKGESPNRLAPALGLSLPTAYQWSSTAMSQAGRRSKPARKTTAFRQMTVVAHPTARSNPEETTAGTNQILVTGPGGLQAVGLGVTELAELLRRLGC
jgi:hypothetical protein